MKNLYIKISDETHSKLKIAAIKNNMAFAKYVADILDKIANEIQ